MHRIELFRLLRSVALVVGACGLFVQAASAQALNPCAIVASYERALNERDMQAALALFADDATITLAGPRSSSLSGLSQIQQFLRGGDPRSGAPLFYNRQVIGETVMWSERLAGLTSRATDQTIEAVVVHGKIQSLVYRQGTLVPDTGSPGNELAPESASMVLEAEVLLGLGLLSLASVRTRVRSSSNLRGTLLRDLHQWRLRAHVGHLARVPDQEQQRHAEQVGYGQA
jgi:hypothetical protein